MEIEITVRMFAFQAEHAGGGRRKLTLPQGATVGDAVAQLRAELPGLPWAAGTLVAVNQGYASLAETLHAGDELAVIPPVSGG